MNNRELAWQFQSRDNWTGLTPKELRLALEEAIIASCYANVPSYQRAECLAYHENEIDFAIYSMVSAAFPFSDNPNLSLKEINKARENKTFDNNSKNNCFVGYFNTYFYQYIHDVELYRLMRIVDSNDGLPLRDAVDFFITGIVYPEIVDANPGMLVTYQMISGVQPSRLQNLTQISGDIQRAYRANNQVELFKCIYFLMTNFAGTKYRAVHRGVLALFNADMAQFRELIYGQAAYIIEHKGQIAIGGFTE